MNSVAPSSNAPVVTRTDPKNLLSHPPPPPPVKPLPVEPTPTATSPLPPSARPVMTNPLPPSTRPGVKASKAPQPLKLAKPGKVSRRPSNSSMNKSLPTPSKADREKHFPNLSRKIIIPRIEDSSDSEGESEKGLPTKSTMAISSPSSMFGGLNLEAFLKEARNTAPVPSHSSSNKPAQPQKKFMMTPKLKAQAKKLTLADKKKLISSKISHLSRSTQIEFQRLKELLAKKDGGKRTGDPRALINSARPTETPILANADQEVPQSKPSEVSCEEVPKIHHSAPAQDSSATPLEPDAPVEKLSNPPSDAEPPPAEGTGRQRRESDEDEAALRLNLIESMKKSVAEKKSDSENHKEKNTSDGGKEKNPPRKVVHSLKSSAQKEEGGGKMNKGSKGTDSRDKVTVKISPEKGRNVEISSGVTGSSEKKSKDGVIIKKNKNRQDDTAKVGDQRKK